MHSMRGMVVAEKETGIGWGQDPLSWRQTATASSRWMQGPGEAGLTCYLADSNFPGPRRTLCPAKCLLAFCVFKNQVAVLQREEFNSKPQ